MEHGSQPGQDLLAARLVRQAALEYDDYVKWTFLIALLAWPIPALAMNWEGHDDWMEDQPAAVALEKLLDQARPLPPTPCEASKPLADNPYEQVPLHENPCPARPAWPALTAP
jgi:hypothetical protein